MKNATNYQAHLLGKPFQQPLSEPAVKNFPAVVFTTEVSQPKLAGDRRFYPSVGSRIPGELQASCVAIESPHVQ